MAESLVSQQEEFTRHIRNPAEEPAPPAIESRRMKIYNDLVYNNIEGFISGGFPVLRSLYRDEDWHRLIRGFVRDYRCSTPFFLQISEEFLHYLMEVYQPSPVDPPFLIELAHYEWVELALDVAESEPAELALDRQADPLTSVPRLSSLAWSLSYRFPVHTIGPGTEPDEAPAQPTWLLVYRNRDEQVCFMETNAATARLLELVRDNVDSLTGEQLLAQLAREMNAESITPIMEYGARTLNEFLELGVLAGSIPPQ